MKSINIPAVVEAKNLDLNMVASQLFPDNKHPRLALNRVISGVAVLDANQISKLSLLSGVPISELFSGGSWKASNKEHLHIFTNSEFIAELDTSNWTTKIFHNESMFHEHVLHDKHIALTAYLDMLNSEILKFKNNAEN